MKYSRNPKSGEVEVYSDDGVFIGKICSMGDSVKKSIAMDGGAGSGNFGHAGRPGQRGGSAKRGGGGGSGGGSEAESEAFKARSKLIQKLRNDFKKKSKTEKIAFLREKGVMPPKGDHVAAQAFVDAGKKKGMDVDKYVDYCAARYFTIEKFKQTYIPGGKPLYGSGEYKTPLKPVASQEKHIYERSDRIQKIQDDLGVDTKTATMMERGLARHFGSGTAVDPWIDRYIDGDGRYEGAIYRWKGYWGDKADSVVKSLVPGAKLSNPYGSNWSFSSDPEATKEFGSYDSPGYTTICYICDDNKTASPVQCFSGYGAGEAEVIPHSKTTYTIQSVEKVPKENGGYMYEVHMTEDDWHEEQGIPVWSYEEYQKEWEENFPTDDLDADNLFQDIKANHGDKMSKFLEKCPNGTMIYSPDSKTVIYKNNGDWYGYEFDIMKLDSDADMVYEMSWENNKEKAQKVGSAAQNTAWKEDSYVFSMNKPEKTYEQALSEFEKIVSSGDEDATKSFLKEAPSGTQFTALSLSGKLTFTKMDNGDWKEKDNLAFDESEDDIWMYADEHAKLTKYPSKQDVSSGAEFDFKKAVNKVQDTMDTSEMVSFCEGAPVGTSIETVFKPISNQTMKFTKQPDGSWLDENGVYSKPAQSSWLWTMVTEEDSKLVAYPKSQPKLPGDAPKGYGEAESKLMDVTGNQDYEGTEKFLDSLPDGTVLYDEDTDKFYEKKKVSDTLSQWVDDDEHVTYTSGVFSGSVVNKQSFSFHHIPIPPPKSVDEANKQFGDLASNYPAKVDDFVLKSPEGTEIFTFGDNPTIYKQCGLQKWMKMPLPDDGYDSDAWEKNKDKAVEVPTKEWFTVMLKDIKQASAYGKYGK